MAKTAAAPRVLRDLTQSAPKPTAKPSTALTLAAGFEAQNVRCLSVKDGTNQIWSYTNDYKGKPYFHIRQVYMTDDGAWHPGKGLSMSGDKKDAFIAALVG